MFRKLFNTNTAHNLLNVAIAVLGATSLFDWSTFFEPQTGLQIAGALALTKIVINAVRDGFAGMVKDQPPVK